MPQAVCFETVAAKMARKSRSARAARISRTTVVIGPGPLGAARGLESEGMLRRVPQAQLHIATSVTIPAITANWG